MASVVYWSGDVFKKLEIVLHTASYGSIYKHMYNTKMVFKQIKGQFN